MKRLSWCVPLISSCASEAAMREITWPGVTLRLVEATAVCVVMWMITRKDG